MLAAGLLCAAPSATAQVLATVDGKPITEADLRLAEREAGAGLAVPPEERRRVLLEVLIQRQALANEAEREGLSTGGDYSQRLDYARRSVLQQLLLDKRAREALTEDDAKRVYDEQFAARKPEDEVHIRQILLASESAARAARDRVANGADFAAIARSESLDRPVLATQGGHCPGAREEQGARTGQALA